ncbi:hypothetical protein ACVWYH_010280 [Bradyrhizobium sp. GM24.11]
MFSGQRTTQGTLTLPSGPAHPLRVRGRKAAGRRKPHGAASEWQKRLQGRSGHHTRYPQWEPANGGLRQSGIFTRSAGNPIMQVSGKSATSATGIFRSHAN